MGLCPISLQKGLVPFETHLREVNNKYQVSFPSFLQEKRQGFGDSVPIKKEYNNLDLYRSREYICRHTNHMM